MQELVRSLPLSKQVFTLDALHCQTETTTLITASDNDYIIALKRNQKKLFEAAVNISESQLPKTQAVSLDISHGRQITRQVSVYDIDALTATGVDASKWGKLASLIQVTRSGKRGQKDYQHLAYYISSLSTSAEVFASKIRGHWLIENRLHWVKDVIFQEDRWRHPHFQTAANFSILKTAALNLYRFLGFFSIKAGQRWLNNKLDKLILIAH